MKVTSKHHVDTLTRVDGQIDAGMSKSRLQLELTMTEALGLLEIITCTEAPPESISVEAVSAKLVANIKSLFQMQQHAQNTKYPTVKLMEDETGKALRKTRREHKVALERLQRNWSLRNDETPPTRPAKTPKVQFRQGSRTVGWEEDFAKRPIADYVEFWVDDGTPTSPLKKARVSWDWADATVVSLDDLPIISVKCPAWSLFHQLADVFARLHKIDPAPRTAEQFIAVLLAVGAEDASDIKPSGTYLEIDFGEDD